MWLVVRKCLDVGMALLAVVVLCPSWAHLDHAFPSGLGVALTSPRNEKLVSDDSADLVISASIDREERFEDRDGVSSLDALPGSPPVAAENTNPPQRAAGRTPGENVLRILASLTARAPPSISLDH